MRERQDEQEVIVKIAMPREFVCPITGNIMSEPVILHSAHQDENGKITHYQHRYERIAIIRALYDKNKKLCPLNRQPITGNLNELPLDKELQARIEAFHQKRKFKKFDPLAYILNLENGNIASALLFFCRYERRYADQFVLQHQDKIAQLTSEQYRVGDNNLLARVLKTGYSHSIILNSLTPEQAAAAILHRIKTSGMR